MVRRIVGAVFEGCEEPLQVRSGPCGTTDDRRPTQHNKIVS